MTYWDMMFIIFVVNLPVLLWSRALIAERKVLETIIEAEIKCLSSKTLPK
jgi:hypothetical protein